MEGRRVRLEDVDGWWNGTENGNKFRLTSNSDMVLIIYCMVLTSATCLQVLRKMKQYQN